MAEWLDTWLDARKLLMLNLSNKWKEYLVEGNLLNLWDVVDGYIQFLTKDIQSKQSILTAASQEQYESTRQLLQRQILQINGFDIWKIATASVDQGGFLQLSFKNGHKEKWNIVSHWNNILLPKPSTTPIVQAAREKEAKLQEQINKESYFGGSVIVEYAPSAVIWTVWVIALGQWAHQMSSMVKSIMIRTDSGQMMTVKLDQIYTGSKEILQNSLMKILQSAGYIFDAGKKLFFDPILRALTQWVDAARSITYEQWKRIPWNEKISEIDFRKYREEFLTRGKPAFEMISKWAIPTGKVLATMAGYVTENAMHLFFLPIFFQKFSKYQNNVTLLQGASEMVLFTAWAKYLPQAPKAATFILDGASGFVNGTKIGTRVANGVNKIPMPKILRPIFATVMPLALWWLSVVWWEHIAQKYLDANRAKWRYFNGNGIGSQYTDGYSAIGHATGLWITDALHQVNKFARWANDEEEWDLGIPRIEVPLWKWASFSTPEITWFQDKINFGTNPWEWVRWAAGRDINTWNQYVDLYRPRLKKTIYDLLWKYARDEWIFSDKDFVKWKWWKDALLREYMVDILEAGSTWVAFNAEKQRLVENIMIEVPNVLRSKWPTQSMDMIINWEVEMMKVDTFFIKQRTDALEWRKEGINNMVDQLSTGLDQKSKEYIKSILARMVANQPVFAPDVNMDKKIWRQSIRNRVASDENKLFHQILDNDTIITIDGKSMKTWEYFSIILDSMLDWKRESEFLNMLKKWNKKWVEWTL